MSLLRRRKVSQIGDRLWFIKLFDCKGEFASSSIHANSYFARIEAGKKKKKKGEIVNSSS